MCPDCSAEVEESRWFCPTCDAPLHERDEIIPGGDRPCGPSGDAGRVPAPAAYGAEPELVDPGEPDAPGRIFKQRLQKSWLIRVLVTILILGILIGAILLISRTRKGASGALPAVAAAVASLGAAVPNSGAVDYDNSSDDISEGVGLWQSMRRKYQRGHVMSAATSSSGSRGCATGAARSSGPSRPGGSA